MNAADVVSFRALARLLAIALIGLASTFMADAQMVPVITIHPTNLTVDFGQSASFVVSANGDPAPEFQWRFNDVPLSGETNATLVIGSAEMSDAGGYSVIVSNLHGIAISDTATLTVVAEAPVITVHPTNFVTQAGQNISMEVIAFGTPEPGYQWMF